MNRRIISGILGAFLIGGAGFAIGQRSQPVVSINPELAWYRMDGAALKGTTEKRLALATLRFNDVTIPCVVMDGKPGPLSRDLMSPSLSCGWTPEIIAALTAANTK